MEGKGGGRCESRAAKEGSGSRTTKGGSGSRAMKGKRVRDVKMGDNGKKGWDD